MYDRSFILFFVVAVKIIGSTSMYLVTLSSGRTCNFCPFFHCLFQQNYEHHLVTLFLHLPLPHRPLYYSTVQMFAAQMEVCCGYTAHINPMPRHYNYLKMIILLLRLYYCSSEKVEFTSFLFPPWCHLSSPSFPAMCHWSPLFSM